MSSPHVGAVHGNPHRFQARAVRRLEEPVTAAVEETAETAVEESTEETVVPITEEETGATDHSRRHVQRSLRHIVRLVRHEIKDAVRENGELEPETREAIGDLVKDFRDDLKDAFHAAGSGNDFDRSTILSGISDAITNLTDGLRALRESLQPEEAPPSDITPEPAPIDEKIVEDPALPEVEIAPGGLVSELA